MRSQTQRLEILEKIEKKLKIEFTNILVEISPENDALRFKGEGLFSSGSRQLRIAERKVVEKLAELLTNAIECHTIGPIGVDYSECNPEGIIIEAVQIEGHTDSQGSAEANIGLSTDRANAAYFAMTKKQTNLLQYRNIRGQPVISVAGYGEMRPVASNETREGKAENRRIDLRLIMYTPNSREQVERIQNNIAEGISIFNESGFNEP